MSGCAAAVAAGELARSQLCRNTSLAARTKLYSLAGILVSSALGVVSPFLLARVLAGVGGGRALLLVKCFAAGVVLATALVHVLPDAQEALADCHVPPAWHEDFPVAGAVSLAGAVVALLVDLLASSSHGSHHHSNYVRVDSGSPAKRPGDLEHEDAALIVDRSSVEESKRVNETTLYEARSEKVGGLDHEQSNNRDMAAHVDSVKHNQPSCVGVENAHLSPPDNNRSRDSGNLAIAGANLGCHHESLDTMIIGIEDGEEDKEMRLKQKMVSKVLEIGIVFHSVIIGATVGMSQDVCSIRPLAVALCFHQIFEGMGLGGCIAQAGFGLSTVACMCLMFSVTTPLGIILGMVIFGLTGFDDSSPSALIIEGILGAFSAGILIYMALVDLIAVDFFHNKVMSSAAWLKKASFVALVLGSMAMSVLALWA